MTSYIINKYIKNKLIITNFDNYITFIIDKIKDKNEELNELFIKTYKIYKLYSPSKNENKFIFGILVQLSLIDYLNTLFYKCIDLDELKKYGSEFKNDCKLFLTNFISFDISIKAKSKKNGNIIIINHHNNIIKHNLERLITIIIILETYSIYIIPHKIVDKKYIIDNDSNISYKSSLISYIDKNYKKLKIDLIKNEKFNSFILNEYKDLEPVNVYKDLYLKL